MNIDQHEVETTQLNQINATDITSQNNSHNTRRRRSSQQNQLQDYTIEQQNSQHLIIQGLNLYNSDSLKEEIQEQADNVQNKQEKERTTNSTHNMLLMGQTTLRNVEQDSVTDGTPLTVQTDRLGLLLKKNDSQGQRLSTNEKENNKEKREKRRQKAPRVSENESQIVKSKQKEMKTKMRQIFYKIKLQMNIKFFVSKMLSLIQKKQYQVFQKYPQYQQMIDDKASSFNINSKNKSSQELSQNQETLFYLMLEYQNASNFQILWSKLKLKEKFLILLERIPVFLPFSIYRMIWDQIQLVMISFFFILIPLHIAFNDFLANVEYVETLAIIFFAFITLDIVVISNTCLFTQGKLIENRQQIIVHYMNNGLQKDIVALFPLLFLIIFNNSSFYSHYKPIFDPFLVIFYSKIENCQGFFKKIETRFHFSPRIGQILKLSNLLFLNLFIIHCCACVWILIAFKTNINQSWMSLLQIEQSQWYIQYLSAFYFNTVTMVTVGYGDITPQTNTERLFSILTVLSACGVFAYSITEVGSIFQEMQFYKKQIKQSMYIINNYMKKKNITNELQYQIRDYLEYFWKESKFQDIEQETKIIDQLSNNLKENLMLEANRAFILQSPIFQDNFSVRTILKMISLVKEQKYNPEEIIYYQEETEDLSLYFIEKGQVEVFQNSSNITQTLQQQSFLTLKQGAYFGEKEFFTGQPRKQSFRSKEFTTLLKVNREKFLQIIREDKDDYERHCMIRDSISNRYSLQNIARRCQYCLNVPNQRSDHSESFCPIIHYIPNFDKLQGLYKFNTQQLTRTAHQRSTLKYETKKNLYNTHQVQIQFYSKNLKKIHDHLSKHCPKVDLNQQSSQIGQGQESVKTESNLNKIENTNTAINTNMSGSSEESFQSLNSCDQGRRGSLFSPIRRPQVSNHGPSYKMNHRDSNLFVVKESRENLQLSTFSQRRISKKLSELESSKNNSSRSSSSHSSSSSNSSNNSSQQSQIKKEIISVSFNKDNKDTKSSIDLITDNEFVTMQDVVRDPKVPSIQYLSLDRQAEQRKQRNHINQVSDFSSVSMQQVLQKNSQPTLTPPKITSFFSHLLTFKKLSSEMSPLEVKQIANLYSHKNSSNESSNFETENKDPSQKNYMKNDRFLFKNIYPSEQQTEKHSEIQDRKDFEAVQSENQIRKKSNTFTSHNIKSANEQQNTSDAHLEITQPPIIPLKHISPKQKIYQPGAMRRGSYQVNQVSDFLRRQSIRSNQNVPNQNKLMVVGQMENSHKSHAHSTFQKSKQDISNNLQSVQYMTIIQEMKAVLENQTNQISDKIKSVQEQLIQNKNEESESMLQRHSDLNEQDFSFLEEFDRMRLFDIYFVHNNYDMVIQDITKVQKEKLKLIRKKSDAVNNAQDQLKNTQTNNLFKQNTVIRSSLKQRTSLKTSQFLIGSPSIQNNFNKFQILRSEFGQKSFGSGTNKSNENGSELLFRRNLGKNLNVDAQYTPSMRMLRKNSTDTFSSYLGGHKSPLASPTPDEHRGNEKKKSNISQSHNYIAQLDKIITQSKSYRTQSDNNDSYNDTVKEEGKSNKSKFFLPQAKPNISHQFDFDSLQKSAVSEELSN